MQLFILDKDPELSVQMLCDAHLRKMCLETAQILSSVIFRQNRIIAPGMPKVYSIHHPVIKAVNSPFKINWVLSLNNFLHLEYFYRFNRKHAYADLPELYEKMLFCRTTEEDWSFCRAFKDFQTAQPDIVTAYREYYRFKKSIIRNWHYTRRDEPDWLI